jgi:glycosyltransferase involved in cell wall biosynthesis
MQKQASISLIIPCKNYEERLVFTLSNLQNQFLLPERIIVVDDVGDNPKKCEEICNAFEVEYYRNDNHDGENTPRHPLQIGIDALLDNPTDYFEICGADAYWLPNKLLQEFREIEKDSGIGAVFSNFITSTDNFTNQVVAYKKFTGTQFIDNKVYDIDKNDLLKGCVVPDNSLTRTKCLEIINNKLRDDVHRNFMWDLWLNISEHYRIRMVNTFGSMYWKHGKNISNTWDYKSEEFKALRNLVLDSAKKRRGL